MVEIKLHSNLPAVSSLLVYLLESLPTQSESTSFDRNYDSQVVRFRGKKHFIKFMQVYHRMAREMKRLRSRNAERNS